MNWKMMDLAVKHLNVNALREWKDTVLGMSIWMQAVVVGVLALLIGASLLSLFWGLKMTRSAQFAAGSASVFHIALILLVAEYSMEDRKAFMIAAAAAAAAGFLYAFAERVFQFAAGFVFGTVLTAWLIPACFHMKLTSQPGRVWRLVIAIAAGVVFALLAKKLKFVITALEGGVVLGLLADAFLPVTEIPWISEKLSKDQILNLLPLVLAGIGLLVQLFQLISRIREQRALQIPTGEERDANTFGSENSASEESSAAESGNAAKTQDEEAISMAEAEEVLVEKAKELALAASMSAQNARLKERYEDVSEGLYSAEVAANRLGISREEFLEGMKKSGYAIESGEAQEGTSEESKTQEGTSEEDKAQEGTSEENKIQAAEADQVKKEDAKSVEATTEETKEEALNSEVKAEDLKEGEAKSEETEEAEAKSGESEKGEAKSGESEKGEAKSEDTEKGEADSEDTGEDEVKKSDSKRRKHKGRRH